MKAFFTLFLALLLPTWSAAENIATGGGPLDLLVRTINPCQQCEKMEALRNKFLAAYNKAPAPARSSKDIVQALDETMGYGRKLVDSIEENEITAVRGVPYKNQIEIESFFSLAVSALPFAQDMSLIETIDYINQSLGSRQILDGVLKKHEEGCRKTFFIEALKSQECESKNAGACKELKIDALACESTKRAKEAVKIK